VESARKLEEAWRADAYAPLDFMAPLTADRKSEIRRRLGDRKLPLFPSLQGPPIFEDATASSDTGRTRFRVAGAGSADFVWKYSGGQWVLDAVIVDRNQEHLPSWVDARLREADRIREFDETRRNLLESWKSQAQGIADLFRKRDPDGLIKMAIESQSQLLEKEIRTFFSGLTQLEARSEPIPGENEGLYLSWTIGYVGELQKRDGVYRVEGTVETAWTLEGGYLVLVSFRDRPSVEIRTKDSGVPRSDSSRILRFAQDVDWTDCPVEVALRQLESDLIRFDLDEQIDRKIRLTVFMKGATLQEVLDRICPILRARYRVLPSGTIRIEKTT